ncbi:MAG: TlpA disulfide reductase family protein [Sphingobacteriaceae bacterium]|nr:TlpA disulfide reductase family protein [Sphingobacteriaceae bacterium]
MKKLLLGILLIAGFQAAAQEKQAGLPNVTLKDLQGNTVNIAELASEGKPLIVSFWATWCTPCKKELTNYADLYEDWQANFGVKIVAISIDDARNTAKVKSYVNGVKWPFQVLLDPNEDMKRSLNFQTVPFTILIDKNGNIVYRHNSYVEGDEYVMEEKLKKLSAIAP